MRIPTLLPLLLCISVVSPAQGPPTSPAPADAAFNAAYGLRSIPRVTGRLLHLPAADLQKTVIGYTVVTPFSQTQVHRTSSPRSDGSFRLDLDYAFPYQQIWLSVADTFYAGIYADRDLYVELDMKKIEAAKGVNFNGPGVRYGGTDGPLNEYLNNFELYKRTEQSRLSDTITRLMFARGITETSKLRAFDQLFDSLKRIESDYIAANPSPDSWMLENERLSDYYSKIVTAYIGKIMPDTLWKSVTRHQGYFISNNSAAFYNAMAYYIRYLPGEKTSGQLASLDRAIRRTDSLLPPAAADFLKLRLNVSTDVKEQNAAWERLLSSIQTRWCLAVAKQEYRRAQEKLAVIDKALARSARDASAGILGRPLYRTSFGATLYKISDWQTTDLLTRLRQSYPGKAIVIDRWATWCSPCLSDMPHSKELQAASKDLPVVFVYLCTLRGSSEDKWKSKVMELEQPGIHMLIDEKLDAELSAYFSFNGYPGYAFISKDGKYQAGSSQYVRDMTKETLTSLVNK